jgi:23S rRNA (adenine2503-C2)-methyltransferase
VPAFVRRPRGLDIYAACGQLKRTLELVPSG